MVPNQLLGRVSSRFEIKRADRHADQRKNNGRACKREGDRIAAHQNKKEANEHEDAEPLGVHILPSAFNCAASSSAIAWSVSAFMTAASSSASL